MSKYRIAPYGVDEWKIQKRWFGLLWVDVLWLVAYDTYDRLHFARKEQAINKLAEIFENRRQYIKAAELWQRSIAECGDPGWKQLRVKQITGNWGQFEPISAQPAGDPAVGRDGRGAMALDDGLRLDHVPRLGRREIVARRPRRPGR